MMGMLKLWLSSWTNVQTEAMAAAQLVGNAGTSVGSRVFAFVNSVASSGTMGVAMLSVTLTTVVSTASVVYDVVLDPDSNLQIQGSTFESGVITDGDGNFLSPDSLVYGDDDTSSLQELMSAVHDPNEDHTMFEPFEPDTQWMIDSGLWTEDEVETMSDDPNQSRTNTGTETMSSDNNNNTTTGTNNQTQEEPEAEFMAVITPPSPPVIALTPPTVTIERQPLPVLTVNEGSISGGLIVTASRTGIATLSYQWYQSSGSNSGGSAIPGATGQAFFVPQNLTVGTYYFYVVVTAAGSGGTASRTSNVSMVTVTPPIAPLYNLTILGAGANATPSGMRAQGSTVELNPGRQFGYRFTGWIVTSGNVTLTHLPPIPGYPTARFIMPASDVKVMATWVEIIPTITITREPISQNTQVNMGALLAVIATVNTGEALTYQWYQSFDGSNTGGTKITNATEDLTIVGPYTTPGLYYYYVEISSYGIPEPLVSEVAVITVKTVHTVTVVSDGVGAFVGQRNDEMKTGSFAHDSTVTIYPGTREGFIFKEWVVTSGIQASDITPGNVLFPGSPRTATFIMPATDVTVTATWDDAPPDPFTITMISEGVGAYVSLPQNVPPIAPATKSGQFYANDALLINAGTRTGYRFMGWEVKSGSALFDQTSSPTIFIMPANDVTIEAIWEKAYTVTIEDGGNGASVKYLDLATWTLRDGPFLEDDYIIIEAGFRTGYSFSHWEVTSDNVSLFDENEPVTDFFMPAGNVTVTVKWDVDTAPRFNVTIEDGGNDASALHFNFATFELEAGPFLEGTLVGINAGERTGYEFTGWTISSGAIILENEFAESTTFIMPAEDVIVIANWDELPAPQQYTVTVVSSGLSPFGSGSRPQGADVVIFAGIAPPPGLIFGGWTVTTPTPGPPFALPIPPAAIGMVDANSAATSFTMPPFDVTVTANWLPPFSMPLSLTLDPPEPPIGDCTEPPEPETGEPTDTPEPPNGNPSTGDSTEPPEPETGDPPTSDSTEPPEPEKSESPKSEPPSELQSEEPTTAED